MIEQKDLGEVQNKHFCGLNLPMLDLYEVHQKSKIHFLPILSLSEATDAQNSV